MENFLGKKFSPKVYFSPKFEEETNMKKNFETPVAQIILFESKDIVTSSGVLGDNELPDDTDI